MNESVSVPFSRPLSQTWADVAAGETAHGHLASREGHDEVLDRRVALVDDLDAGLGLPREADDDLDPQEQDDARRSG